MVEYSLSSISKVLSGVPQGSVLGPVLFLLYINDIPDVLSGDTGLKSFADDVKVYSEVFPPLSSPSKSLQLSLNNLSAWSRSWQFDINVNKSFILPITNSNSVLRRDYLLSGSVVPVSAVVNDLGVSYFSNLSFNAHTNNILAIG